MLAKYHGQRRGKQNTTLLASPMRLWHRRPVDKRALLLALFGLQAAAMAEQFARGFIPLVTAPQRIAGSWDMFAVRIERCDLRWDLPVLLTGREVTSLQALAAPPEWSIVLDRVADYRTLAQRAATAANRAHLHCVLPDGSLLRESFAVP